MISYYGAKQKIVKWIISHFPPGYEKLHYIEPYIGGGAVWFNKNPSNIESINDINPSLHAFYKVVKKDYKSLRNLANQVLFTEKTYKTYADIYHGRKPGSDMEKALSVIFLSNYSFGANFREYNNQCAGMLGGPRKDSKKNELRVNRVSSRKTLKNTLIKLNLIAERLATCGIYDRDAIKIITQNNKDYSFFYLDPPYPETDNRTYNLKSCPKRHFKNLIQVLKTIKGKFLLSCYKKDWMKIDPSWKIYEKKTTNCISIRDYKTANRKRTECLIKNY